LNPDFNIEVLGINDRSRSAFNAQATAGRQLPWLQDSNAQNVWTRWGVVYRDVRILDARNELAAVFNLTDFSLAVSANRAALKKLFLDAAAVKDSDSDGLPDAWEWEHFGTLAPAPEEDPDLDGVTHLQEFAFGSSPTQRESRPAFILARGGSDHILRFRHRGGGFMQFRVEVSSDLQQWTSAPEALLAGAVTRNLFDGTGTFETTLPVQLRTDQKLFFRIQGLRRPNSGVPP
jgi:hypothetical protein